MSNNKVRVFFKKNEKKDSHCFRSTLAASLKSLKIRIKHKKFPLLFELIKWKIIDVRRAKRIGVKIHLYGIKMICGLYGQGKTMALTYYLEHMRERYGDSIYIATNYYYTGQDFPITHWKDLLKEYDKPVIFGYDELQNEFNSRDYKNFPLSLMTLLTQNRKGFGKQIIGTAQDYETVDKNFRRLCTEIWNCHTIFGRLTSVSKYWREDYEQLISTPIVKFKMKIKPIGRFRFVQTDDIRERYDSFKMLESAKSKEYVEQLGSNSFKTVGIS